MHWSDNTYIIDAETPVVILIGPPCSGKTMVAQRLFQYLYSRPGGYCIDVDQVFWGLSDNAKYMYNWAMETIDNMEKSSQHYTVPTLYHIRDNTGYYYRGCDKEGKTTSLCNTRP